MINLEAKDRMTTKERLARLIAGKPIDRVPLRHPGGFILMPACELPPNTPLENIEAVAHALHEHGYY